MTKDKRYEFIPGIWVTDATDIEMNHGKRLDISKFKQFDRNLNGVTYSDQQVRDKLGRNNCWSVCKSWTDYKNKKMFYEVLINAKETVIKSVDYNDICQAYGWKSFKWSDNGQMILPNE